MFEKYKLKKKMKMLQKQVEVNDTQAMYDLAMIYLDGSVILKDKEKAHALLQKAASLGHLLSKTYLISNKVKDSISIGSQAIDEILKVISK